MKVRFGHIANSSSSSFIVAFDKMPQNVDDLRRMLFGDKMEHSDLWMENSENTLRIASQVWQDMQSTALYNEYNNLGCGKIEFDNILDIMCSGWVKGQPEIPEKYYKANTQQQRMKILELYVTIVSRYNARMRDIIFKEDDILFRFGYSDNDGEWGSFMEHSDIFKNMRFIRVSHH